MATMILRDDVLRARPIEGDPDLARAIRALSPDVPIVLRIEGRPMRFRKVLDARTGQPSDGISPDVADAATGRPLQTRRVHHRRARDADLRSLPALAEPDRNRPALHVDAMLHASDPT